MPAAGEAERLAAIALLGRLARKCAAWDAAHRASAAADRPQLESEPEL
jgi:hypothetical protein